MSDLELRIKRSLRSLSDSSLPKHKRAVKALKPFKGLELSDLSSEIREMIEHSMLDINEVLKEYELETFHDYKIINNNDLSEIIRIQMLMCNELKRLFEND